MNSLLILISTLINIYIYVVIAAIVMSWLVGFNILNPQNSFARSIYTGLNAVTEPVLRPIRNLLPSVAGIDFSPMILIIVLVFTQNLLWEYQPYSVFVFLALVAFFILTQGRPPRRR